MNKHRHHDTESSAADGRHLTLFKNQNGSDAWRRQSIVLSVALNACRSDLSEALGRHRQHLSNHLAVHLTARQHDIYEHREFSAALAFLSGDPAHGPAIHNAIKLYEKEKTRILADKMKAIMTVAPRPLARIANMFTNKYFVQNASINLGSKKEFLTGEIIDWLCLDVVDYPNLPEFTAATPHLLEATRPSDRAALQDATDVVAVMADKSPTFDLFSFAALQQHVDPQFGVQKNPRNKHLLCTGAVLRIGRLPADSHGQDVPM